MIKICLEKIQKMFYTFEKNSYVNLSLKKPNILVKAFTFTLKKIVIFFDLLYMTICISAFHVKNSFFNKDPKSEKNENFSSTFFPRFIFQVLGKIKWDKFRFMALNSRRTQLNTLRNIINLNKNTIYGVDHKFSEIKSISDYQRLVPLNEYENIRPYIERMCNGERSILTKEVPMLYATTSGTTGKPKFIPITKKTAKLGHSFVQRIWLYHLSMSSPNWLSGKIFAMVSPAVEGHVEDGTAFGSTSGHMYKSIPNIIQKKYLIPSFVMEIEDYTSKYYVMLRLALAERYITYLTTANPSTILLICKKMNEWSDDLINNIEHGTIKSDLKLNKDERTQLGKIIIADPQRAVELKELIKQYGELRPKELWPDLAAIGCWRGGNAGTFLSTLQPYLNEKTEIREIGYLSSEFRGSIPIKFNIESGILTIHENFFEFAEVDSWDNDKKNSRLLLTHELEIGKSYYIFITTNSGLYRYNMNDIIQVTSKFLSTPMITFLQKGKGVTNITGEKLYETQLTSVVERVKKELKLPICFYMGAADMKECLYELIAEFKNCDVNPLMKKEFVERVDRYLCEINLEYNAKRKSLRLKPMILRTLSRGGYDAFKARKVKEGQREGQFKVITLTSDKKIINELFN